LINDIKLIKEVFILILRINQKKRNKSDIIIGSQRGDIGPGRIGTPFM
jgi:hypothetical protein